MPDENASDGASPRSHEQPEHWRELADRASKEPNSQKLIELVQELCDELDAQDAKRKGPHPANS